MRSLTKTLKVSSPLALFALWLFFLFAFGGASRADEAPQLIVRLGAIAICAIVAWQRSWRFDPPRPIPLLFALFLLLTAVQLLPLPPAIWQNLPGRAIFHEPAAPLVDAALWRPISINPYATVNALLSLSVPAATILLCAATPVSSARWVIVMIGSAAIMSAFLGVLQAAGVEHLSLYEVTSAGSAIGIFANRNHQALFLALLLPILSYCAGIRWSRSVGPTQQRWLAGCIGLLVVPLIMVTGSRAGLALLGVGIVGSFALASASVDLRQASRDRRRAFRIGIGLTLAVFALMAAIAITVWSSRAAALSRLFDDDVSQDLRLKLFSPMVDIAAQYFPLGSGVGTFASAFRIDEPFSNLNAAYLNHAHNDLLEIVIEGGAVGGSLAAWLIGWFGYHLYHVWRPRGGRTSAALQRRRLGGLMGAMILLGSLGDYPVRTPIFQALAVIACWLVAQYAAPDADEEAFQGPGPTMRGSVNARSSAGVRSLSPRNDAGSRDA